MISNELSRSNKLSLVKKGLLLLAKSVIKSIFLMLTIFLSSDKRILEFSNLILTIRREAAVEMENATPMDTGVGHVKENRVAAQVDFLYKQCSTARNASAQTVAIEVSDSPEFGLVTDKKLPKIGSLARDSEGTFHGSRISHQGVTVNQSVSISFDPSNLHCMSCTAEHKIIQPNKPLIIAFADQNFVPSLPCENSKDCISVARMEDATLPDLATFALELLDRTRPPPGSILMFGSATHLARNGSTLYARDWVNLVARIKSVWPDTQIVPLYPIPRENCDCGLSREIAELTYWLVTVYKNCNLGLTDAWSVAAKKLSLSGIGENPLSKPETYTLAFPQSLDPKGPLVKLTFSAKSSRPTSLAGLDRKATDELVFALVENLNSSLHTELDPSNFAQGKIKPVATPATKDTKQAVIVVGASNLRGTLDPLRAAGYTVYDLTTPGWVASPVNIANLSEKLRNLDLCDDIPVVLDLMSNSAYRFVQYDGTQSLPHKGKNGYHLPGDVALVENGTISKIITLLEPALSLVTKRNKIIIPPLPRYIVAGCCQNVEHCTNRGSKTYSELVLKDLSRIRNFLKTELAAAGLAAYWVLDWAIVLGEPKPASVGDQLAALSAVSSSDGVHFKRIGYENMATAIAKKLFDFTDGPSREPGPQKFFWRGFVSGEGSKTLAKVPNFSRKKTSFRSHPYRKN